MEIEFIDACVDGTVSLDDMQRVVIRLKGYLRGMVKAMASEINKSRNRDKRIYLNGAKGAFGEVENWLKKQGVPGMEQLLEVEMQQNEAYGRGWADAKSGKKGQQCN